jgi:hypothetical protein
MTRTKQRLFQIILSAAVGAGCLFLSETASLTDPQSLVSTADARIGRPLTPMSYAGVARRTTRRAVAVGAVGAATYGAAVVAPRVGCVQAVDAYGRIYTRC